MSNSAHLKLPFIAPAQAQKHVTHNEALRSLDALVQLAVRDRDLATPPASPAEGDRYIVPAGAAGAWTGQAGKIASWQDGLWEFHAPNPGWLCWVADEGVLLAWSGAAWADALAIISAFQNLTRLGLGTTADAANPFAAKLNKALWTAKTLADGGDGDLRTTLNKEASGDVLGLLFQTGFSARAEAGLLGDDDFTLKVSADGSVWTEAFRVTSATGMITPGPGGIAGGGRLVSHQFFGASGTWTKPTGVRKALVYCVGGGGGGGGGTSAASSVAVGGGGGAGGLSVELVNVSGIASVVVTVGAGGAGGANTGAAGGTGGDTSFGAHCSGAGGLGGLGHTAGAGLVAIKGGAGGDGADGDWNMTGTAGAPAIRLSGAQGISGAGAPSFFGGGAQGNTGNAAGSVGTAPGSGGSGAATNGNGAKAGGAGAGGLVWIAEYE